MSLMSAWYFTEDVTVWHYRGRDPLTHQIAYDPPVTIKAGIEGKARMSRDANGDEFVVATTYYTGYPNIKMLDRVARGIHTGAVRGEEVRNVRRHGMAAFGYDDEYTVEV